MEVVYLMNGLKGGLYELTLLRVGVRQRKRSVIARLILDDGGERKLLADGSRVYEVGI